MRLIVTFINMTTFFSDTMESSGQSNEPIRLSKRDADIGSGPIVTVFSSQRVTVNDSREFVCEVMNTGGMRTEQIVLIQVLGKQCTLIMFVHYSFNHTS